MNARIIRTDVILTAVQLPSGFSLGFGTLKDLPRVYLILTVDSGNERFRSIGEASMDFPFSAYDAWDVYWALDKLPLTGRDIEEREALLSEALSLRLGDGFMAAQAALNMALDDAYGHLTKASIPDLYGIQRLTGPMLVSIGVTKSVSELDTKLNTILAKGGVPKIKCTDDLVYDLQAIRRANIAARTYQGYFVTDFNASLLPHAWEELLLQLSPSNMDRWLFSEQPTEGGANGVADLVDALQKSRLYNGPAIVADESFISKDNAVTLAKADVWLNMKIQKIGGIHQALALEKAALSVNPQTRSLVGGTFPTAIGRAYDQCAAAVLTTVTLPSDGWMPSTDFFTDDQHMIEEIFPRTPQGEITYFNAPGLGCTPVWDKLEKVRIRNPAEEYRKIRTQGYGSRIRITLNADHKNYGQLYTEVSGRDALWNL
jgi:L-alanine-DL-glutamate epimerase-like enolase superfamily enzyme